MKAREFDLTAEPDEQQPQHITDVNQRQLRIVAEKETRSGGRGAANLESSLGPRTGDEPDQSSPSEHRDLALRGSRQNTGHILRGCVKAVEDILSNADDPVEQGNAFLELNDNLADLWSRSKGQEPQFEEFVNLIQCLILKTSPGDLDNQEWKAIATVLDKASYARPMNDDQVAEYVAILAKAGCDVFRELR